jgi:putative flippase GtrA
VGTVNTALSYTVYAIGLWFGFGYALANFIAMVLGTLFSFVTQGRLVFNKLEGGRLPRFVALWIALWLLNVGLIALLLPWVDRSAYLAGAITLVIVTGLSFLAQRHWVFAEKQPR